MRRSQAPSSRSWINPTNPAISSNIAGCCQGPVRSTESIVNLLSKGGLSNEVDENLEPEISNVHSTTISSTNEDCSEDSVAPCNNLEIFNVVYGKQSKKKHKTWEGDGTLQVGVKYLTLKDENGKILGTGPRSKAKQIEAGTRLFIGSKEVEVIDKIINSEVEVINKISKDKSAAEKRILSPVVKPPLKKPKLRVGHGFIVPQGNSAGLPLPDPSPIHVWYFNKEGLPATNVIVEPFLARQLRKHQQVGVTFLYECVMGFRENNISGAILADEMGLGKTLQCIALIWTLLKQGPYGGRPAVKKVLIVTPSSLTKNWANEFLKWLGRERLRLFVVDQKNKPSDFNSSYPVMIVSYEMFVRYSEEISKYGFDLLICDEGHRLKNSGIQTTQLLNQLSCDKRVLLTGTPIQNDLQEFFALINFVNPNALGSAAEFRRLFEDPILKSRQPSADEDTRLAGEDRAAELNRKTSVFLLRRTHEVLDKYLPTKHEVVVFCRPTELQRQVYNSLVATLGSKTNMTGLWDGPAHLGLICTLKKVCNHPGLTLRQEDDEVDGLHVSDSMKQAFPQLDSAVSTMSTEHSGKLTLTINLLSSLGQSSPREKMVLVSNSTQTLDMLADVCGQLGLGACRLDGSTPAAARQGIVDGFNSAHSTSTVFLLSAKAGGVGLNLTGASRLVLFDSDWNPATDLQAMSRIWRDGQKHSVFIYRLLTTGTIEEKIYQRQLNKQGLCDGTVDPHNARSIKLSKEELRDLFAECSRLDSCATHDLLCDCPGQGAVPQSDTGPTEPTRTCQLSLPGVAPDSTLKMNELLHWEHHGTPFHSAILDQLKLTSSQDLISFIFKNSVS